MTTTSQQPHADDPSWGPGAHGSSPGGNAPRNRRGSLVVAVVAVVVVIAVAVLGWLFTAGPLSESASQEREIEQALEQLGESESFAEFNSFLCAEQRVPQELVDTIAESGEQTGSDLDAMFRESIAGSLPERIRVAEVEISGDVATVTIESGDDGQDSEEVRMRHEDDEWKVCQSGVGMGSVPDTAPGDIPG